MDRKASRATTLMAAALVILAAMPDTASARSSGKQGLAKTRGLFSGVAELFRFKGRVDKKFLEELEKRLYLADVGTAATADIVDGVRQAFKDKEIGDRASWQPQLQAITIQLHSPSEISASSSPQRLCSR